MDTVAVDRIRAAIRPVPDFPKPGIIFKDITPILQDPALLRETLEQLAACAERDEIHIVASPEARGFIFGVPLAVRLGCGFVPLRKPGKLPYKTVSVTYALEYGQDAIAMHEDAIQPGQRVLLVDDVLATGGTMKACADLIESRGGVVTACVFFLELGFLKGRHRLKDYRVHSLIRE